MMIGRLVAGVLVGPPPGLAVAAGGRVAPGAEVAPEAGACVAPAGRDVAAGFITAGTGVATLPAGTTAPLTSQPVTPDESRTCRQVRPSTSRSGPSTSTGAPSASVFRTRP